MRGQRFEIEHLCASLVECGEQTAFTGASHAAHHVPVKLRGQGGEISDHHAAIGFIAAVQPRRAPADLCQHMRQRATAPAAAPAVDQRFPAARLVVKTVTQMAGDVVANECCTDLFGIERRHLFINGADCHTLGVVQYRAVDGPGDMIVGELAFAAHVDNLVKARQLCYGYIDRRARVSLDLIRVVRVVHPP